MNNGRIQGAQAPPPFITLNTLVFKVFQFSITDHVSSIPASCSLLLLITDYASLITALLSLYTYGKLNPLNFLRNCDAGLIPAPHRFLLFLKQQHILTNERW